MIGDRHERAHYAAAAWAQDLPAREKLHLLALVELARDEGECMVSLAQLSALCGGSARTAIRSLNDLQRRGLVQRIPSMNEHGGRAANRYQLTLPTQGADA